jgi:hypothetical protein
VYKGLLEYLHEKNYDGYVATEYEGNRFTLPGKPMQEKDPILGSLLSTPASIFGLRPLVLFPALVCLAV